MGGQGRQGKAAGIPSRAAKRVALAAMALVAFPGVALALSVPGDAPVMRRLPGESEVTIVKQSDLQFGQVVMLGSGGSVMVPANGLASYFNVVPAGVSPTTARFEIRGPANKTVDLLLTFPLSGQYGQTGIAKLDSLSVSADYSTGFRQDGSAVQLRLDSGGTNTITIGGKLTLSTDTPGRTDILIPIMATLIK